MKLKKVIKINLNGKIFFLSSPFLLFAQFSPFQKSCFTGEFIVLYLYLYMNPPERLDYLLARSDVGNEVSL